MFSNRNGVWRQPMFCGTSGKPQGFMFWLNLQELTPPSSSSLLLCEPASRRAPSITGYKLRSPEQCPAYPGFITDSQCPRQVKPPHLVLQPWPWRRPCWHGYTQPHRPCILPLPATGGAVFSAWLINECHSHFMLTPLPHFTGSSYKVHAFPISFDLYLSYEDTLLHPHPWSFHPLFLDVGLH